ncbi:MAG: hypothetical protein CMJ46_13770 [Planctomyces sp.]|nr:hypothetical protein [Planctomyces sp.]
MSANYYSSPLTAPSEYGASRVFSRKRLLIIGGILFLVACGVIWDEFFKYQYFAKRFGTVIEGEIYRSGQISVAMFEPTIKEHNIQVVIDLTGYDYTDPEQVNEVETSERLGIEHCRYRLDGDGRGDIMQYATTIEKLVECQAQNKPVLVHCAAGAHRTGGVVACYRMLLEGVPADEAYDEMCDYGLRGGVEGRLPVYINEHMEELATELVRRGVLREMPRELPQIGRASIPVSYPGLEVRSAEQHGEKEPLENGETQKSERTASL